MRTVSNSVADMRPLSRNNAARRSRCSTTVPVVVIERASLTVNKPFVTNTRTRGSLIADLLSAVVDVPAFFSSTARAAAVVDMAGSAAALGVCATARDTAFKSKTNMRNRR